MTGGNRMKVLIVGAGGQGGHPRAHVAAAEEVILFTGALGLAEEVQADGHHENEIGYKYGKLDIVHKNPSLFRYMK